MFFKDEVKELPFDRLLIALRYITLYCRPYDLLHDNLIQLVNLVSGLFIVDRNKVIFVPKGNVKILSSYEDFKLV